MSSSTAALKVTNGLITLTFDPSNGAWRALSRTDDGVSYINHNCLPSPAVDVRLDGQWIFRQLSWSLLEHHLCESDEGSALELIYAVGQDLRFFVCTIPRYVVHSRYLLPRDQACVRRSLSLEINRRYSYYGLRRGRVAGVRFLVPGAALGPTGNCTVELPGERHVPRTPYIVRAAMPECAAEGQTDHFGLLSCPDLSPGVVAIHNAKQEASLLVGYDCQDEPAFPFVWGHNQRLWIAHEHGLAVDLLEGQSVEAGRQIVQLETGPWRDARRNYRANVLDRFLTVPTDRPAWARDTVVGEVSHCVPGGIAAMRRALPAWHEMGIRVLYLMPTNPGGYAPASFEGVAPNLGSEQELCDLVKDAHRLGMRVLLDMLMTIQSPGGDLVRAHPDWFIRDERGRILPSIAWGGCSLDWGNPQLQDYLIATAVDRVRRCDVDGFRVDAPEHKEVNWSLLPPARASDSSMGAARLLQRLRPALREVKPDVALLCESHGPLFHSTTDLSYACPAYWLEWLFQAVSAGRFTGADLRRWLADQTALLPEQAERLYLVKSHDVARPFSFDRHPYQRTLQAIFALIPGSVMVYLSHTGSHDCSGTELRYCAELFNLRHRLADLLTADCDFEAPACENPAVFCCLRRSADGWYLPLANLSPEIQRTQVPLPDSASRVRRVWPEEQELSPGPTDRLVVELPPWASQLYHGC